MTAAQLDHFLSELDARECEIVRLKAIAHEAICISYGGDLSIAAYERLAELARLVDNPPPGGA